MSVLIKDMKMPAKQVLAVINPDGLIEILNSDNILVEEFYAVPVPPHGDLIDRDALPWEKQSLMEADEGWALPCVLIEDAPTIIPAELPVHHGTFAAASEKEALERIIPAEEGK